MTAKEKIIARLLKEGTITVADAIILNDYKAINMIEEVKDSSVIDNKYKDLISKHS